MQYRKFGNTNEELSLLGMGCMRLPFIDDNNKEKGVNREAAYELIQYAVDNGINYFDTAYSYHSRTSEEILGEALQQGGRREKVKISTKQPFAVMTTQADIRTNLENTLKKLRTSYVDFYFIHGIGEGIWADVQKRKIYEEFEKFKAEGLIRHIGFSYHGNAELFKEVVQRYPWEMCLVQHNLLDIKREVTADGIRFAHKHGLAVAIMEPLRGGGLAQTPAPVADVYSNFEKQRSAADWAFRYLANMPEITSISSGMSNMEQLKDNLQLFNAFDMKENNLNPAETELINKARAAYESIVTIPCTECRYCVPCPQNVDIPGILSLYNNARRFGHFDQPRRSYMFTRRGGRGAANCNNCGDCIPKCPQNINIPQDLQTAHKALDGWEE